MPALTKTQIEHAKSRITAAKDAFIHRHMAALGEEPDVVEYSDEQKVAMIRSGEAKLRANINPDRCYGELTNFFVYVDTPELAEARKRHAVWEEAAKRVHDEAHTKEQALLDELIMSPDGKAALEKIAAAFS